MNLYGFEVDESIRAGVVASLPLLREIKSDDIRNRVIDAWAISLSQNGYQRLEDVPGLPEMDYTCNQSQHYHIVTTLSLAVYDTFSQTLAQPLELDRDILIAGAMCHDLGNPYEFSRVKRKDWQQDVKKEGLPCLRHPFYGVYLAMLVGLPEGVAHIISSHAGEGNMIKRSLPATIVYEIDNMYWHIVKSANNVY